MKDLEKLDNPIRRPPNSFILFRTSFVGDKSLPVKANRVEQSKIIGVLWHKLSPQERREWDLKAKRVSEEHKRKYPDYIFKPIQKKARAKVKAKAKGGSGKRKTTKTDSAGTERWVRIAELIAQGLRGDELNTAMKEFNLDRNIPRFQEPVTPGMQRSSKVSSSRNGRRICTTCHQPRPGVKKPRRNSLTPSVSPATAEDTYTHTETNTPLVRSYASSIVR